MAILKFMKRTANCRLATWALGALLCVSGPAYCRAKPQLLVRATFASTSFNDGVAAKRQLWEQAVATHLTQRIEPLLGFAAWNAMADTSTPVLGELILRLTEDGGGDMPPVIGKWFFKIGAAAEQPLPWLPVTLYQRNDPNLAANIQLLQQRTIDALALVSGDALRDNLLADFTPKIPLVRQATANPADKVLELPLRIEELPLGPGSKMDVTFNKPAPNGADGVIKLTRFGHANSGKLRGGVDEVILNALPLQLTDNWNSKLDSLLKGTAVECFLITYDPARVVGRIDTGLQ